MSYILSNKSPLDKNIRMKASIEYPISFFLFQKIELYFVILDLLRISEQTQQIHLK